MSCWNCDPPEPVPYCAACRTDCTRAEPCSCCCSTAFTRSHRLPEEVLAAFERRIPGARETASRDVLAMHARAILVHFLAVTDAAMADEDVPARTRHRVLNALAYGSVTPPDVATREREAALAQKARFLPPVSIAGLTVPGGYDPKQQGHFHG